ncbi:MAG: peptidoglycan editing factor PgeF [Burkholderiales bacterium]|nr:peptidoglycan editing factor PgeF [Burkholderiales bacterium]
MGSAGARGHARIVAGTRIVSAHGWIVPDWPAPPTVRALITTRAGGASRSAYAGLNLGLHCGDDIGAVVRNRASLRQWLPAEPLWLRQVHGTTVVEADAAEGNPEADAALARRPGRVCAALTADCLPLLLCDEAGTTVAAVHAGWRGLSSGVIEQTLRAMNRPARALLAYLGPAIGPGAYEVGAEVRAAFIAADPGGESGSAFAPGAPGKYYADLYALARLRLARSGVARIYGGGYCTYTERARFYSYRRDGATGRMASLIWMEN